MFSQSVTPSIDDSEELKPLLLFRKPAKILTPPLLCPTCYFLPPWLHFGFLQLICSENRAGLSHAGTKALAASVAIWKGPSILLVAASTSTTESEVGKQIVVGAFIPTPWNVKADTNFASGDSLIFRRRPVQEVFRTHRANGLQHARFSDRGLHFGREASLHSARNTSARSGSFTYRGNWSGDYRSYIYDHLPQTEHFMIEEVEVWELESRR